MDIFSGGATLTNCFCLPEKQIYSKGLLWSRFFPFRVNSFWRGMLCRRTNMNSESCLPYQKWQKIFTKYIKLIRYLYTMWLIQLSFHPPPFEYESKPIRCCMEDKTLSTYHIRLMLQKTSNWVIFFWHGIAQDKVLFLFKSIDIFLYLHGIICYGLKVPVHICTVRPWRYKKFFMLNSTKHEISLGHKSKNINN